MEPSQSKCRRASRLLLGGLAVILLLAGLFYAVEDWRGKQAWNHGKSALQAQGLKMDWADFIPAAVSADQNVFGVPEMQKWFTGEAKSDLTKKLVYPGSGSNGPSVMVAAELKIGLPGTNAPKDSSVTVLKWEEPRARIEFSRMMKEVLGPVVVDASGFIVTLRSREEIRPVRIYLQCSKAPTRRELLRFLVTPVANSTQPDTERFQIDSTGRNAYKVLLNSAGTFPDYLKWCEQFEPEFTLIREALQRPQLRMEGDYSDAARIPAPNYETTRALSERLATMAQCHLALGKPEEALRDLTLMCSLCRVFEGSQPMSITTARMDAAFRGYEADTIATCMRWHAWRDPQLAALEEQLQRINLLAPMRQAFAAQPAIKCYSLKTVPPSRLMPALRNQENYPVLAALIPQGWIYQNMATAANLYPANVVAALDPTNQTVFPDKLNGVDDKNQHLSTNRSPYAVLAVDRLPSFSKAAQAAALNQTLVNQALIACALERYHLAHGEYPETLDALAPQFVTGVPHDVIGSKPLHYRRVADGTFVLYSVGWNGKDDGGVSGKAVTDGDWVWLL